MNLSTTHLERMVRTEFECGAMGYCQKMKLNKAFLLLQNTDLPIRQIAELLKFYDESHFCSFFKGLWLVTPNHSPNQPRNFLKTAGALRPWAAGIFPVKKPRLL